MNISINAHKVAKALTDKDLLQKSLLGMESYVKHVRDTPEWVRRYDYYLKVLKKHAEIKG
jgi:hypothetical protein